MQVFYNTTRIRPRVVNPDYVVKTNVNVSHWKLKGAKSGEKMAT